MKKLSKFYGLILIIGFVIGFCWYVFSQWEYFQNIVVANPWYLLITVAFIVINILAIGMALEIAVEPHGIKLQVQEIFGLAVISRFANHVFPAGIGATIRALYLKKNYGVSYTKFTSSISVSVLLQFLVTGILSVTIYLFLQLKSEGSVFVYLLFGFILILFFLFFPFTKALNFLPWFKSKLGKKILDLVASFEMVRSSPKTFFRCCYWVLISTLSAAACVYTIYLSIEVEISFLASLFIASISVWGMMISITPGNLGVREGIMIFGATLIKLPLPETLVMAMIFRLMTVSIATFFSMFYSQKLLGLSIKEVGCLNKKNADFDD